MSKHDPAGGTHCFATLTDYQSCGCVVADETASPNDLTCNLSQFSNTGYCCATHGYPDEPGGSCGCTEAHCAQISSGLCGCEIDRHMPGMAAFPGNLPIVQSCQSSATVGCCLYADYCDCSTQWASACPAGDVRLPSCSIEVMSNHCNDTTMDPEPQDKVYSCAP